MEHHSQAEDIICPVAESALSGSAAIFIKAVIIIGRQSKNTSTVSMQKATARRQKPA
jgi:hypothetical protein